MTTEKSVQDMSEEEMRDANVPWFKTQEELDVYIKSLLERPHDYGTCVYAMSMAAVATYNFVAHKLGVTGFQASCADMDFLKRTRDLKHGFRIVNYDNILYPQYWDVEVSAIYKKALLEDKSHGTFAKAAQEKLDSSIELHPNVRAHLEIIANGKIP